MNLLHKIFAITSIVTIVTVTIFCIRSYRQNGIIFIEDIDEKQEADEVDRFSNDSMDLRYSNEYQTWKNTTDTTFQSLFNGNQQADILAMRPRMVVLWAGYAFSKDYATPRGHMYAIEDLYKSLRTGAPHGQQKRTAAGSLLGL